MKNLDNFVSSWKSKIFAKFLITVLKKVQVKIGKKEVEKVQVRVEKQLWI